MECLVLNKLQDGVCRQTGSLPRLERGQLRSERRCCSRSLLITLLRNSERVKVACQAQLVNTIAPIRAEQRVLPGGKHLLPVCRYGHRAKGTVVKLDVAGPTVHSDLYGEVGAWTPCARWAPNRRSRHFCINRSQLGSIDLAVDVRALPMLSRVEHRCWAAPTVRIELGCRSWHVVRGRRVGLV